MLSDEQIVQRCIVLCVAVSAIGLIVIIAYLTVCWRKHRGKRMPETHPTDWVAGLLVTLGYVVWYAGMAASVGSFAVLANCVPHYRGWSVVTLTVCTALLLLSPVLGLLVGSYATERTQRTGRVFVEHNAKGEYRLGKASWVFKVDSRNWFARLRAFVWYMVDQPVPDRRWSRILYLYSAPAETRKQVDAYLGGLEGILLPNKEAADKELEKLAEQFGIRPRLSKGSAYILTYGT